MWTQGVFGATDYWNALANPFPATEFICSALEWLLTQHFLCQGDTLKLHSFFIPFFFLFFVLFHCFWVRLFQVFFVLVVEESWRSPAQEQSKWWLHSLPSTAEAPFHSTTATLISLTTPKETLWWSWKESTAACLSLSAWFINQHYLACHMPG